MHTYENPTFITAYIQSVVPEPLTRPVTRVTEGGSTIVYRVETQSATTYLRVWPEQGEGFGPERIVHDTLHAEGLHVPAVLGCEDQPPQLDRAVMLTTAIPGRPIGYTTQPPTSAAIVRQAGRELARINSVPVRGYGWIRRTVPTANALQAEYDTPAEWLHAHFDAPLNALGRRGTFDAHEVERIRIALEPAIDVFAHEPACLAHGDFDTTHIFYDGDSYSGIIDFGEIRGTHRLYDLGHFAIENSVLLPALLEGYGEITPLPADAMDSILITGMLIAARRIGTRLLQDRPFHQPDVAFVTRTLEVLRI